MKEEIENVKNNLNTAKDSLCLICEKLDWIIIQNMDDKEFCEHAAKDFKKLDKIRNTIYAALNELNEMDEMDA